MKGFLQAFLISGVVTISLAAPRRLPKKPLYRDEFQIEPESRSDNGQFVFRDAVNELPVNERTQQLDSPRLPGSQRIRARQSPALFPVRNQSKRQGEFFRPYKTWQSESYADSHYASDYSAPQAEYDPPGLTRVRKYSL